MGFEPLAYRGLETGSREVVSHVIKQGKVSARPGVWVVRAPVCPGWGMLLFQDTRLTDSKMYG